MIGTLEIKCFAAKPQMPLPPVFAFRGSPSSLRILDVPRRIGTWEITAVKVAATYPDNSIAVAEAVRTGNVWVATFTGCGVSGKTANGIQVIADGTDENGDAVEGYVLGCGDLYILNRDSSIAADDSKWYVRYCDEAPATPSTGDLVIDNGAVRIYDGAEWVTIETDLSAYATKQEVAEALTNKQNTLSNAQVSAIGSVVDERQTVVEYDKIPPRAYDIYGTMNVDDIRVEGSNITNIKIGRGVITLGTELFMNSPLMTSIELPDSLKHIDTNAFTTSNITSLVIPDSVETINAYAFSSSRAVSITVGSGVDAIGQGAFDNCNYLTSLVFKGKTIAEVQAMSDYPWGISDPSIIKTWNDASKEWVGGNYLKTQVLTQAEYDAITPDPSTMYVIVAE